MSFRRWLVTVKGWTAEAAALEVARIRAKIAAM